MSLFIWSITVLMFKDVRTRVCIWAPACIESSGALGKGMPALWQMVGINLAASPFLSMSTPPTWLPTLPRVYFSSQGSNLHTVC